MIFVGADWHLDRYIWKSRKDLEGDAYKALEDATRVIVEHPAKNKSVLLAGDICNTRKVDGLTLKAITEFIKKLRTCGISVYFILGNHDKGEILGGEEKDDIVSVLSVQGAIHLNEKYAKIDGRTVTGLDWRPREDLQASLPKVNACDILLLHCKMEHLCGYKMAADAAIEDIPAYVKDVVVGDIHTKDASAMANSPGLCISPGALHPCDITQGGDHGIWGIEEGSDEWQFFKVASRNIYRYRIPDSEDDEVAEVSYKEITEFLLNNTETPHPLVEISYPTARTSLVDRIMSKCVGTAHFFTKPGATGKLIEQGDLDKIRSGIDALTLEGSLEEVVSPKKEPDVHNFLHALLTAPSPLELVQAKVEEVLGAANKA